MGEWLINTGTKRSIKVVGKTLESAVKNYGKNTQRKKITCGLLVRVKQPDGTYGYWSGERFLECLG